MDLALGQGSRVPVTSPHIRTHAARSLDADQGRVSARRGPPTSASKGGERQGADLAEGRAPRAPGPTPKRPGRLTYDKGDSPHAAPARPGASKGAPHVRGQTSTGSLLAARGPKSWGGHTRGELWPGGPSHWQTRVSHRRNLAPRFSISWWGTPGARDHPSPGVPRERLPKDTGSITSGAGWRGVGPRRLAPVDTPEAGPRPNHRSR